MATITLQAPDLLKALNFCSKAQSKDESRYYMQGINLHVKGSQVVCEATDGHVLARTLIDPVNPVEDTFKAFLRTDIVSFLQSQIKKQKTPVEITVENDNVTIKTLLSTINYSTKGISFPDTREILRTQSEPHRTINRKEVLEGLKLFKGQSVTLSISDSTVIVENITTTPKHAVHTNVTASLLSTALVSLKDHCEVHIAFQDKQSPMYLTANKDLFIVMPCRG